MIDLLEKTLKLTMLFDHYGSLLTERQQKIMKLYFFHDLSLSEIGEKLAISRQCVHDHLHRAEDLLYNYEKKLKLVQKNKKLKKQIDKLINDINNLNTEKKVKNNLLENLDMVKKIY